MTYQDPLIGRRLANFRIERLLGRGGMARVYYGWDEKLERPVAIKITDERYRGNPVYDDRFLREARAVAALQHPNILNIYHADEDEGMPYYAMEYIRGLDVGQIIRQYAASGERMPYADVLRIGRAVARALDYAHQRGVIHRDVKPSNVLVSEDGRVVLTDFGLAMNISQGTRGEVFGSPLYIAPEQARGSANVVPQSDLYSLGVMLFEMLTGALPFEDDSPAALALKHVTEPPPYPSHVNPALRSAVDRVLLKALSKNPADRYRCGRELIDALEDALYAPGAAGATPVASHLPAVPPPRDTMHTPVSRVSVDQRVAQHLEENPPVVEAPGRDLPPGSTVPSLMRGPRRFSWSPILRIWLAWGLIQVLCILALIAILEFSKSGRGSAAPGLPDTPTSQLPAEETGYLTATDDVAVEVQFTGTPTPTPTLTLTPSPAANYELTLLWRKDESLLLANLGDMEFPLEDLLVGNKNGEIEGAEWEVDSILPGECVVVVQETGKPRLPNDIDCQEVGERLERNGREKFWTSDFDVYYLGDQVGECDKDKGICEVVFPVTEP